MTESGWTFFGKLAVTRTPDPNRPTYGSKEGSLWPRGSFVQGEGANAYRQRAPAIDRLGRRLLPCPCLPLFVIIACNTRCNTSRCAVCLHATVCAMVAWNFSLRTVAKNRIFRMHVNRLTYFRRETTMQLVIFVYVMLSLWLVSWHCSASRLSWIFMNIYRLYRNV